VKLASLREVKDILQRRHKIWKLAMTAFRFGNAIRVEKDTRQTSTGEWLDRLLYDTRFGLRQLHKSPGFAAVAILTLALGIGANATMFSLVNGVLLKPLPYPDPNRLAYLGLRTQTGDLSDSMSVNDFLALESRQRSFDAVAALETFDYAWTFHGTPKQIAGTAVTAGFFSVLGVKPLIGRTFVHNEDKPGQKLVVVVSHHFWKNHLLAAPDAIGRELTLDGRRYTVIGVMAQDFNFGSRDTDQLWPIRQLTPTSKRQPFFLTVIARLKSGVTYGQAVADASAIAKGVLELYDRDGSLSSAGIRPMKQVLIGNVEQELLMLLSAVAMVLLIAVVNVANLQVARACTRKKEMAIRSALGAGRARLIVQLLTENVLLALIGAALGLLVAWWSVSAVCGLVGGIVPRLNEVTVDAHVLAFTGTIALVSGILFGLVPALHWQESSVNESLKEGGRVSSDVRGRRVRKVLVVAECSLALVLLIGSGLLVRSLSRLQSVNPGFNPDHTLAVPLSLPSQRYPDSARVIAFCQELLRKMENTPGVKSAALSKSLPPNLLDWENPFYLPGEHASPDKLPKLAELIPASGSYFQTLDVPLLRGRTFIDADRASSVMIVNRAVAERYFPGQDPVGKQLYTGEPAPKTAPYTIVGEVGDVKYQGLESDKFPTLYLPYFSERWSLLFAAHMYLVVHAAGDESQIIPAVRSAVWSIDSSLPVEGGFTMNELLTGSVAGNQFRAGLFGAFAGLAVLLAVIGIYGVLAFVVTERRHEVGIRMALGAQRTDVFRLLLWEGAKIVAAGIALGVVASLALTRTMRRLLFGVEPTDPLTFAAMATLLFVVALAACYIPSRRAMCVDPMAALRYE
jgi:predicted permease